MRLTNNITMKVLNEYPIFFIVGRPRSGTTLLRTLFDANPNVCIPPECQFIINLFPKYGKLVHWKKSNFHDFLNDLKGQWLFSTWNIDDEQLLEKLIAVGESTNYNEVCKLVFMQYKSLFKKDEVLFFGDKNPGYTIYTEQLLEIFPNAKFIHIIRDYRDHFVSIKNVDFDLPYISLIAFKWRLFIKKYREMMEKYPLSHIEIRYEDLVRDPENQMKHLCKFTGINYNQDILNFYLKGDEARKIYPSKLLDKIHSSLFNKISPDKIGVYKSQLSLKQIKIADFTVGKYAELAGYKKVYTGFNLVIILSAIPGITLAKTLQLLTQFVDHLPYHLRARILNRWPLMIARLYLRIFNPDKLKGLSRESLH